ncbi:Metallo-dependent phosphatase-like protein [Chytridium lagenaria]|nr:Metallo-dependent phosphatase-like protein [Chytridium lagenaria]
MWHATKPVAMLLGLGIFGCVLLLTLMDRLLISRPFTPTSYLDSPRLTYNKVFKIALFSDLHYGEEPSTEWGPLQDENSTRVVEGILDAESPNFVIFLGDQVTGENISSNATAYLEKLYKPLVSRKIPWASVYGNHDAGAHFGRKELLDYEMSWNLSSTQRGPQSVHGLNYYLPLFDETGGIKFLLWFLDSNGGVANDVNEPSWIVSNQVKWLRSESEKLYSKFGSLPSLVFFHIPLKTASTLNESKDFPASCSGFRGENNLGVQIIDEGILDAIQSLKTRVIAIFNGHDHGTSWCCKSSELADASICFGRHSGYGGYGNWDRGARVLQLKDDSDYQLNTWLRLENGTVMDETILF